MYDGRGNKMSVTLSKKKLVAYIAVAVIVSVLVSGAGVYYFFQPVKEERTLVISVWGGPWYDGAKKIADEFTKTTGIRTIVSQHTLVVPEVVPKIEASMPDPVIDVIYCSTGQFPTLMAKNLLAPIDETVVTNLGDTPTVAKWVQDGKTYGVGIYAYGYVLVYNTEYVKEPIDELKDLLMPELKGKVAIATPEYDVGIISPVYFALANGGDEYQADKGFELIKEFAEAGVFGVIVHTDADIIRVLSTGEAWVAMGFGATLMEPYKKGIPLEPIVTLKDVPKQPIAWDGLAVVDGPRKDLAMKYLEFALQPDKAGQWANDVSSVPVNSKAIVLDPEILDWNLSAEQVDEYGYARDVEYCTEQYDEWLTRFEEEIKLLIE